MPDIIGGIDEFSGRFRGSSGAGSMRSPSIDVTEQDAEITSTAEDIDVPVSDSLLAIAGEKKQATGRDEPATA